MRWALPLMNPLLKCQGINEMIGLQDLKQPSLLAKSELGEVLEKLVLT